MNGKVNRIVTDAKTSLVLVVIIALRTSDEMLLGN